VVQRSCYTLRSHPGPERRDRINRVNTVFFIDVLTRMRYSMLSMEKDEYE
jgi:hypothetical protein